jgi:hypothetical protein
MNPIASTRKIFFAAAALAIAASIAKRRATQAKQVTRSNGENCRESLDEFPLFIRDVIKFED